jgi:hypothetical protein
MPVILYYWLRWNLQNEVLKTPIGPGAHEALETFFSQPEEYAFVQ